MPAQKRPAPPPPDSHQLLPLSEPADSNLDDDGGNSPPPTSSSSSAAPTTEQQQQQPPPPPQEQRRQEEQERGDEKGMPTPLPPQQDQENDSEDDTATDEEGSPSSSIAPAAAVAADKDNKTVLVNLADLRKEVQCPICLGIIRKTRTVMECLHRFCRECIDKSMRLGNNECPACRTHCASRRSLRDDPNYDALIAALYPDIDKYEKEELAFHEEEKTRNKKIQAFIAETLRKQTEALGRRRSNAKATEAAFVRKSHGNYRSTHGQSSYARGRSRNSSRDFGLMGSDEDEDDTNGNEGGKDSSSADEPSPDVGRSKRCRRWAAPRFSPVLTASNVDGGCDENDDVGTGRENLGASPGRLGSRDVLVWGKGGARSQTRHGNLGGTNGKNGKGSRLPKLVDYLHNLEENEEEFDVHLTLLPLDEQSLPSLQRPYLCCRPTLSVRHICQFIALQIAIQAEEVEVLIRKPRETSLVNPFTYADDPISHGSCDHLEDERGLQILEAQESLAGLYAYFSSSQGNLVLAYRSKSQN